MPKIRNHLGRNLKSVAGKDKLTRKRRSALMSLIRSKNTDFETKFFKRLKKDGVKFEAHPKDILGHPDFVIRRKKICVFLDSDFWHGWQYPRWKHKLKNDWWREKIERNRRRDDRVTRTLRRSGWSVVRIWEHEAKEIRFRPLLGKPATVCAS